MADVSTNDVTFKYSEEIIRGSRNTEAATRYTAIEPNNITANGKNITVTSREPLGTDGQRRKGVPTDEDSAFGYEGDITEGELDLVLNAISTGRAPNGDLAWKWGVSATSSGSYSVPAALVSAQADKLIYTTGSAPRSLIKASGFRNPANNGIRALGGTVSTGTTIRVSGTTVTEAASNNSRLEIAGIRGGTGSFRLSVDANDGTGTITSSDTSFSFNEIGLAIGQVIRIGGDENANAFSGGVGNARITSLTDREIGLDALDPSLATDLGSGKQIDIRFRQFYRNVGRRHADYIRRSYTTEIALPGLGTDSRGRDVDLYEYSTGNEANQVTFTINRQDKATMTFDFVSRNTEDLTDTITPGSENNTSLPLGLTAYSNSDHLGRVRITNLDNEGIATIFDQVAVTINRNATARKVLGQRNAYSINLGLLDVTMTGTALLNNRGVIDAINNNITCSFRVEFDNEDGGFVIEIPSMILSEGSKTFTANEEVTIAVTGTAFADANFNTSFSVSTLP